LACGSWRAPSGGARRPFDHEAGRLEGAGIMFRDIGERNGVTETDFVGWGDCDLIYGRVADFLDLTHNFGIIGGFHGQVQGVRNVG
jgi:hypothetical protein